MIDYLVDDKSAISQQVVEHGAITRDVRLHIYKNAYQARLKETIDNDHQILGLYLGDDLFDQMVSGYIQAYPSQSTSLRHYADFLPQFLHQHEPFSSHPIMSELAHFERLLMVAFDAADVERFTREKLVATPHENWPSLVFRFHPSVQLAGFELNTVESWQALKQEQAPAPAIAAKNTWLLWRNYDRLTQFRSVTKQEHDLLIMMLQGADFASLCEYLIADTGEEDISQLALNYLLTWIDDGILAKK
jgi:hypothetical protein